PWSGMIPTGEPSTNLLRCRSLQRTRERHHAADQDLDAVRGASRRDAGERGGGGARLRGRRDSERTSDPSGRTAWRRKSTPPPPPRSPNPERKGSPHQERKVCC